MISSLENESQTPASAFENLKISFIVSKIKVLESIWCGLSKPVREGHKSSKKDSAQLGLPVLTKSPKTTANHSFSRFSGIIFGLFLKTGKPD